MGNTLVKKSLLGGRLVQRYSREAGDGTSGGGGADGTSTGGDGDEGAGGDDADDDDGDGDEDEGEGKGRKDSEKSKTVPESKYLQLKKHLAEADRKKQAALDELKQLKTKDMPEAEKVAAERDEAVQMATTYKGRFEKLARTNAFLMASGDLKITWANSASALKLADMEDLEINDDGSVDGIKDVVRALAKDHPYLLAPSEGTDEKKPPKSGSVVGSTKRGKKTQEDIDKDELLKRFPALR